MTAFSPGFRTTLSCISPSRSAGRRAATAVQSCISRVMPAFDSFAASCGDSHEKRRGLRRSEEHTSELQSLMRISYAVFCLKQTNMQQKQLRHNIKVIDRRQKM